MVSCRAAIVCWRLCPGLRVGQPAVVAAAAPGVAQHECDSPAPTRGTRRPARTRPTSQPCGVSAVKLDGLCNRLFLLLLGLLPPCGSCGMETERSKPQAPKGPKHIQVECPARRRKHPHWRRCLTRFACDPLCPRALAQLLHSLRHTLPGPSTTHLSTALVRTQAFECCQELRGGRSSRLPPPDQQQHTETAPCSQGGEPSPALLRALGGGYGG